MDEDKTRARENDVARAKLAALGLAVQDTAPGLKAVVQHPPDSEDWHLHVCHSYVAPGTVERVFCRRLNGGEFWFFYEWGDPICQADHIMRAALAVASIMGARTTV